MFIALLIFSSFLFFCVCFFYHFKTALRLLKDLYVQVVGTFVPKDSLMGREKIETNQSNLGFFWKS